MSTPLEKIVTEALLLGPEARAFVAARLLESLDATPSAELPPAWGEELRRRCQEIDTASVELSDAAEALARAHAAIG
jgi:hypothetical protein